ncbi:MAG: hypothetical protein EOP21_06090 [Hyphomicrobiales bacterium]|nr:MAG: hypothetical protein EOP21_06090 [Hyphomicrobiales bacterium]
MTIKSALSVAALTIALTGAAFAQGMTINGVAVSETDMPAVQERCDQLANAEATESLSPTTDTTSGEAKGETSGGNDATAANDAVTEEAPGPNEAQAATAMIDLDTIDLQACTDGGFVTQ